MPGGNSHQRAVERAARSRIAKQVSDAVTQVLSETPTLLPQKQKRNIGKLMWSWPVVGGALFFIWGGALTFMTSAHPILADIFYVVGAFLFLLKFLTWEEHKNQWPTKRRRFSVAGVLGTCLLMAFAVWGNHRLNPKALPSTTTVSAKTPADQPSETIKKLPDLRWRYDVVLFGHVTDDDTGQRLHAPGGCNIIVVGEVSNSGEVASIARSWQLTVRMSGEQQIRPTNLLAPGRTTFQTGPTKEFLSMSFKDYLPEETTTEAIVSGNNKVGFLVFAVNEVTVERIMAAGNTLTLGFEDVIGRIYKFDFVTTGARDLPRLSIPGLTRVK